MRVSSVSYGFTKNLRNFQSQRVDATVELTEGDNFDFDDALELASAVVNEALDIPLDSAQRGALSRERRRAQESR